MQDSDLLARLIAAVYPHIDDDQELQQVKMQFEIILHDYTVARAETAIEPIFVKKGTKVYNSTVNDLLEKHCKNIGAEPISVHGLRHTHASLLLYAGASVASVSKRLGHSNMATTQKVYLHIIQELENQDVDLMMRSLSAL